LLYLRCITENLKDQEPKCLRNLKGTIKKKQQL